MPLYVTQLRIPQQVFGMHLKYLPPSPLTLLTPHKSPLMAVVSGKFLLNCMWPCHTSRRLVRSLWGPRSSSCILSMAPGMCKMLRMPLSIPVSFNAVTDSLCFFFFLCPHSTSLCPGFYFPSPPTTTCPTKCRQYFSNFRFPEKAKVQRRFALFRSCP